MQKFLLDMARADDRCRAAHHAPAEYRRKTAADLNPQAAE
jgi:hypothetical protein